MLNCSHIATFMNKPYVSTLVHGNVYNETNHVLIIKRRPRKTRAESTHKTKLGGRLGRQNLEENIRKQE
jgi:hypothetical protein